MAYSSNWLTEMLVYLSISLLNVTKPTCYGGGEKQRVTGVTKPMCYAVLRVLRQAVGRMGPSFREKTACYVIVITSLKATHDDA